MEAEIAVESHRKPGWFWADNTIIDDYGAAMGPYGIALYTALARHADNKGRECYPSYSTLAKETGMSRNKAIQTAELLVKLGLLAIEHRPPVDPAHDMHQTNVFRLLPVTITVTIYTPKEGVVHTVNHPSACGALPLVQDVDHGSAPHAPKEDSVNKTHKEQDRGAPTPLPVKRPAAVETTIPDGLVPMLLKDERFRVWLTANVPGVPDSAIRLELAKFEAWAQSKGQRFKDWTAAARKWLLGVKEWPRHAMIAPRTLPGPPVPMDDGAARRRAQRAARPVDEATAI